MAIVISWAVEVLNYVMERKMLHTMQHCAERDAKQVQFQTAAGRSLAQREHIEVHVFPTGIAQPVRGIQVRVAELASAS